MKARLTVPAVLTAAVLALSACGTGDGDSPGEDTDDTAAGVPDELVIYRPGMVDTELTADDLPHWPGPDPAEFLEPDAPSGERGTISGTDAATVYDVAQENPETLLEEHQAPADADEALWWVDGQADWLVIEPAR